MDLRVLQNNVDRAKVVAEELRAVAVREGIGVLLIQEPYVSREGEVVGYGLGARVVVGRDRPWAAIVVLDPEVGVVRLGGLCTTNCVVAEVVKGGRSVYVASVYCQASEGIGGYLEWMRRVRRVLRGKDLIIGMDANAKNPAWGGSTLDAKGEELMMCLEELELVCLNDGKEPTFANWRGQSYIDITVATRSVANRIERWRVEVEWSSSYHRAIAWEVRGEACGVGSGMRRGGGSRVRYALRTADWDKFREELEKGKEECMRMRICSKKTMIGMVDKVHAWIGLAAKKTMRGGVRRLGMARWWCEELEDWKRRVVTQRRRFQRERCECEKVRQGAEYRRVRGEYRDRCRRAREVSWAKLVEDEVEKGPWNLLYKLAVGKARRERPMEMVGGEEVVSWEESGDNILAGLVVDDSEEGEIEIHKTIRTRVKEYRPEFGERWTLSKGEVREAVWRCKSGKAPGWDGLAVEMLKEGWEVIGDVLLRMYRGCVRLRVFPDRWKWGLIRALLKGEEKDPTEVRSYRPICLLPVLGKIMERVIVGKMEEVFEGATSIYQYGYMKGRGTEDAMEAVGKAVNERGEKYVMGVFLDLTGAFDRLWWPGVFDRLREKGVGKEGYELLQDYLSKRKVEIRVGGGSRRKEVNRGCPQGSVLGPQIWKLVFNEVLELLNEEECRMVGYADDGVVVVWGRSRVDLENRVERVMGVLTAWLVKAKMVLSETKTVLMMLRGDFHRERMPVIEVQNKRLRFVEKVRYLGVTWDKGWRVRTHVGEVMAKAEKGFREVVRHFRGGGKGRWGCMEVIYRGFYVAVVLHGAGVWGGNLLGRERGTVRKGQRKALLGWTRAYKTASTDALCVVAGVPPLDWELERRWAMRRVKREGTIEWRGVRIEGEGVKGKTWRRMQDLWQEEWSGSEKGRWTHELIGDVRARQEMKWMYVNHYTAQMLLGHGDFKEKLMGFTLVDDPRCRCGEVENVRHVLTECERYDRWRQEMWGELDKIGIERTLGNLLQEGGYEGFARYSEKVLRKKEEEWRRGMEVYG